MSSSPLNWRQRVQVLLRGRLAVVHETEDMIAVGRGFNASERDREDYDREEILEDALDAWRLNPLARRIVGLTTQYVVGGGIIINCKHDATRKFINDFWDNRLNRMKTRCYELCDELTRTGNLFLLITTDRAGMSYVRAYPADQIDHIDARANDIEQPVRFWPKPSTDDPDPAPIDAYDDQDEGLSEAGFKPVMLHYTINRPVGAQWGESDLAPVLKWLSRYSGWLEDRARLNRFRNSFLFVVKAPFISEEDRKLRQANLAAHPPTPGSILVCDESEEWSVISPKLEAYEANEDGLSMKKMVASGVGIPMHFLAEPESSTRTTAEAAGGPTFRHFEQRQNYFLWVMQDILKVIVHRRDQVDKRISKNADIQVSGSDISARDNVSLSLSAANITNTMNTLRDRGLIDNTEFLRMVYRFANEPIDLVEMQARAKAEGAQEVNPGLEEEKVPDGKDKIGTKSDNPVIDMETGEVKPKKYEN